MKYLPCMVCWNGETSAPTRRVTFGGNVNFAPSEPTTKESYSQNDYTPIYTLSQQSGCSPQKCYAEGDLDDSVAAQTDHRMGPNKFDCTSLS